MVGHFLPRVFPVPRLLAMGGGGIEITGDAIRYVQFDSTLPLRQVTSFGVEPLSAGVVVDGDIKDSAALVEALTRVREKCGFSFVHASLPEQKGYLFDISVSRDPNLSLKENIELSLPAHVPLSPAEMVFDCETILSESDASTRAVAVTAFPESTAQGYADAFCAAGFSPLSFELEPQAAARALLLHSGYQGHPLLLVDFSTTKTTLSVVQGGVVRFTMSSEGSTALNAELQALVKAAKEGESVPAEVARMKYEEGVVPGGVGSEACGRAGGALAAVVKRVLVYWQSRVMNGERHDAISQVVLYGEDAHIRGLCDVLTKAGGVPCQLADLRSAFGGEDAVPPIQKKDSLLYTTAIGLALRAGTYSL